MSSNGRAFQRYGNLRLAEQKCISVITMIYRLWIFSLTSVSHVINFVERECTGEPTIGSPLLSRLSVEHNRLAWTRASCLCILSRCRVELASSLCRVRTCTTRARRVRTAAKKFARNEIDARVKKKYPRRGAVPPPWDDPRQETTSVCSFFGVVKPLNLLLHIQAGKLKVLRTTAAEWLYI